MVKTKHLGFHEYRYQIIPISQQIQMDIAGEIKSIDELKCKKNKFFKKIAQEIDSFSYSRGKIVHKKVAITDNIFLFKIGVKRDLKRRTREFEVEDIENWEPALIAFNNDPSIQKCLIQQSSGFQKTLTVAKILEDNFNKHLLRYQLSIIFEPIYEENYFWELVKKHKDKITQIDFELIAPNMSNISSSLNIDLGELNRSTNTVKTHLQLNSDKSSHLTPSQEDRFINGLVEYSSKGGGDITLRAKGIKKVLHTSKGINQVDIDEVAIEGTSVDNIVSLFKELMK